MKDCVMPCLAAFFLGNLFQIWVRYVASRKDKS